MTNKFESSNQSDLEKKDVFGDAQSFEDIYKMIEERDGLETSNGHQDAEMAKNIARVFELSDQFLHFISNQEGLRDVVVKIKLAQKKELEELLTKIFEKK